MKYTPFLRQIACHFYARHKDELYKYRFYFQNRRAGIFFLHYLKEEATQRKETIFLPVVTTLTDELYRLAGLEHPDPNNDIFIIYEIYRVILEEAGKGGEEAKRWQRLYSEKFSDFYQLGSFILNDFNDIDKQLADAEKIYLNAHEHLEIDLEFGRELSETENQVIRQLLGKDYSSLAPFGNGDKEYVQSFVSIFSLLADLYQLTKSRLRAKGLLYSGMLLRDAVEEGGSSSFTPDKDFRHVVVGLNALSEAEKKLLNLYKDKAKALFYWDYEGIVFHAEDELMDLGTVMRENLRNYPMPKDDDYIPFEKVDSLPQVEVVSIPSKVAQTVFMTQNRLVSILSSSGALYDPNFEEKIKALEVAVVLPNERLLMPLLSNLPGEASEINVTMGYPVKETPLAGMLLRIMVLFRMISSRGKTGKSEPYYLSSELMELLSMNALDPLFKGTQILRTISGYLEEEHVFRLDAQAVNLLVTFLATRAEDNPCYQKAVSFVREIVAFPPKEAGGEPQGKWLLNYFIGLVSDLEAKAKENRTSSQELFSADGVEEMVVSDQTVYVFIKDLLQDRVSALFGSDIDEIEIDLKIMSDLLKGLLSNARIPYEGEPLKGLQVIGILETRSLDFDTIFIPDASEGILPAHSQLNTLIPYNVRQGNGLPTYKWQELTRSYNFFRLISRASKVYASFDSRKNESSDGEPSRYLRLLEYIYGPKQSGAVVKTGTASYIVQAADSPQSELVTDPDKIDQYRLNVTSSLPDPKNKRGEEQIPNFSGLKYRSISASALNSYMTCPKLFYYRYIEGRKDDDPSTGLLEEKDKGVLLHETLRVLYEPFMGKQLETDVLRKWLSEEDETIHTEMYRIFRSLFGNMSTEGYNANELNVIEDFIRRVIKYDAEYFSGWVYVGGEVHFSGKLKVPEVRVSQDVGDGSESEEYTGKELLVNVSGDIDRILLSPDDRTLLVIDFKTGYDKYSTTTDRFDTGKFEHVVSQLSFYSLLAGEFAFMQKGLGSSLFKSLALDVQVDLSVVDRIAPAVFKPLDGKPMKISYGSGNEVTDFMHQDIKKSSKDSINLYDWFTKEIVIKNVSGITKLGQTYPARNTGACAYCIVRQLCPTASQS